MEEDDYYPKTLQEELNEITEAFYAMISEEDIRGYQAHLEDIQNQRIAQGAVQAVATAPDFELQDQDDETVRLGDLIQQGPVVLVFYRGKWCPHCNATLLAYQRALERIKSKGASFVAISPMLPDGTQVLASKRHLQFPVLSDVGNVVARKYKLTFTIPEQFRPMFEPYNLPGTYGDESWEIPCPATYVINKRGEIVWSFIDNDPNCRGEPDDVIAAIPTDNDKQEIKQEKDDEQPNKDGRNTKMLRAGLKKNAKKLLFGRKREKPLEYVSQFLIRDEANTHRVKDPDKESSS